MISELMGDLARANIAFAAATAAVLAIRPAVLKLSGARVRYALWLLPPAAALATLVPAMKVAAPIVLPTANATAAARAAEIVTGPVQPVATAPFPWMTVLLALWIGGMMVAALLVARRQGQFLRKAKAGDLGPAVVGVLAPRIHLPADFTRRFSAEEQALILAHEEAHLARQDARINGLIAVARCVNWFNPVVHLAAHVARLDQETACDEAVVTRFPAGRKTYAEAMLKTQLAPSPLPLGCYWPSRSPLPLERRIQMLKTRAPGLGRRLAGAFAILTLTTGAGLAAWAAQPPRSEAGIFQPLAFGRADAPVTIVEYSSLGCPHCAIQFGVSKAIKDRYVDTGQVRYIFADMTLGQKGAAESALLARCAGPDRYYKLAEAIYARQMEIYKAKDPMVPLLAIARSQGISKAAFKRCESPANLAAMKALNQSNAGVGQIEGTPTLIITSANGRQTRLLGDTSLAKVEAAIRGVNEGAHAAASAPRPLASARIAPPASPLQAAMAKGDWQAAARLGATAADVVRSEQSHGRLTGLDPEETVVAIGPDGKILNAYAQRPLMALDGENRGRTVSLGGAGSATFGLPLGSVLLQPKAEQPTAQPISLRPSANAAGPLAFTRSSKPMNLRFDMTSPVTVTGTVARVDWGGANAVIAVREASGKEWYVFTGSAADLARAGATRKSLRAGMTVKVNGFNARNQTYETGCGMYADIQNVTGADGRALFQKTASLAAIRSAAPSA